MNKSELVAAMAKESGMTKKDTDAAVNAFVNVVGEALKNGDRVQLTGFGAFSAAERPAREGRNPATGETIKIPAKRSPKFKAGSALKDLVAGK